MSSTAAEPIETATSFDRLISENAAALNRLASGYTNSVGDRDDLLQEIALAVWRALPRFRGECSPRTFLFRIGHNRALAWLAQKKKFIPLDGGEITLRDSTPDPEAQYAAGQRNRLLFEAVRGLPIVYRQVIMLALEDLDYREISQVLGISEGNAAVRLNRAKQLLRKYMGKTI